MINDKPNFFDISFVLVPADRIAGTLRKIASASLETKVSAPLSVFLSSPDPITAAKAASLAKLAEIEKEIEGNISGVLDSNITSGLPQTDLPEPFMNSMCGCGHQEAISSLNNARILLSLPEYLKLVLGSKYSEVADDVPSALNSLPTIFNDLKDSSDLDEVMGYDDFSNILGNNIRGPSIPNDIMSGFSLKQQPVTNRSIKIIITGGNMKNASTNKSKLITKRGAYLAKEYARYAIAFAAEGSSLDRRLLIAKNRLQY
jgi:hypothetical protein